MLKHLTMIVSHICTFLTVWYVRRHVSMWDAKHGSLLWDVMMDDAKVRCHRLRLWTVIGFDEYRLDFQKEIHESMCVFLLHSYSLNQRYICQRLPSLLWLRLFTFSPVRASTAMWVNVGVGGWVHTCVYGVLHSDCMSESLFACIHWVSIFLVSLEWVLSGPMYAYIHK